MPARAPHQPLSTPLRNARLAEALSRVSLFLSPSRYLAEQYVQAGLPADRILHLPNGIELGRFRPEAPIPPRAPFLFLGYLGPHKGPFVLLEAMARAERGVRLQMAGDGESSGDLRRAARELGIAGRVDFLGPVANEAVPDLLAAARGLVLPALWPENAPVTIVEAMAAGRPVIASRAGGIPELVEDGRSGRLVPPGDAEALAAALNELAGENGTVAALGAEGRRRAEGFDLGRIAERLEEIYREHIAASTPPRRWDRPTVAIADRAGIGRPAELLRVLERAESIAGRFRLSSWSRRWPGEETPGADSGPPDVLVLPDDADADAAARALEGRIPFVALARPGSAVARLAANSGLGHAGTEPEALGEKLGRLLQEPGGNAGPLRLSSRPAGRHPAATPPAPGTAPRAPRRSPGAS